MSAYRLGIDLGGTKIAAVALDEAGGTLASLRRETPRGDYRGLIKTLGEMCEQLQTRLPDAPPRLPVGIGIPGSLSPTTGLVRNANSTWLNGKPLLADLRQALDRPVRIANDANCLALSEAHDGAGRGCRTVFAVILGTGCGGGVAVDGRLIEGRNLIAGEWGHTPLPWATAGEAPGPRCWCGRRGCMELWVSGSGLARDHAAVAGWKMTGEMIIAAAQSGDEAAAATVVRHAERLARGLAMVVNILDPDMIVLGGGLSALTHLYNQLPQLMAPYVFCDHCDIAIAPARHGPASGVRGAARLWPQNAEDAS